MARQIVIKKIVYGDGRVKGFLVNGILHELETEKFKSELNAMRSFMNALAGILSDLDGIMDE